MIRKQQEDIQIDCRAKPKLRTFIEIKNFFKIPAFLTLPMSYFFRSFISKARLGCLPLRIETARYSRPRIPAEERYCQICENVDNSVECIYHFMFVCNTYSNERLTWKSKLQLPDHFNLFTKKEKLITVLSEACNVKATARFISIAFDKRSKLVKTAQSNIYHTDPPEDCLAYKENG